MPDSQHTFTTTPQPIIRSGEFSWGGSRGWETDIDQADGVVIDESGIRPGNTISRGLIAFWELNEGEGETAHDSASSHDAALMNGAWWGSGGDVNTAALAFDGDDDAAETTGITMTAIAPRSYSMWVYYEGSLDQSYPRLLSFQSPEQDGAGMEFAVDYESGNIAVYDGTWYVTDVSVPTQTWTHFAFTYDGATGIVYRNGSRSDSLGLNEREHIGPVTLGNRQGHYNEGITGKLALTRVYDRVLTNTEVERLSTAP